MVNSKKRILFVVTVYRVGERIHPIIPYLYKFCDIDLLKLNEMSDDMTVYGNIDYRQLFHKKYDSFFDNIYDGKIKSIESMGGKNDKPSQTILDLDYNKYDMIIYDDDRNRHGMSTIYEKSKDKCPLIGNVHGNWWFPEKSHIPESYKKAFGNVFVFGQKEKGAHTPNDFILTGGIPSNDDLKYYDRTNDYILIIVNFLGNRSLPYDVSVDNKFIEKIKLLEIQKKYNKKVVFKLKSRADYPYPQRDLDYIKSIVPDDLDYITIIDFEDNNQLICGAFLVISAPSTLAFKSIQKGIPTILVDRAGIVGNFYDYSGLIDLDDEDIFKKIEYQIENSDKNKDFIENTIEGGIDFSSTEKYVNKVMGIM